MQPIEMQHKVIKSCFCLYCVREALMQLYGNFFATIGSGEYYYELNKDIIYCSAIGLGCTCNKLVIIQ